MLTEHEQRANDEARHAHRALIPPQVDDDLIDRAKAALEGVTGELEAALRSYSQADYEGVMVTVSRQACEEGADAIATARQLVPDLIAALEAAEAKLATVELEIRAEVARQIIEGYDRLGSAAIEGLRRAFEGEK